MQESNYYSEYTKWKDNLVADALSRIDFNANELDDLTSVIANNDDHDYQDLVNERIETETVHSNIENLVLTIPFSERHVNNYKHQVILDISTNALTTVRTKNKFSHIKDNMSSSQVKIQKNTFKITPKNSLVLKSHMHYIS